MNSLHLHLLWVYILVTKKKSYFFPSYLETIIMNNEFFTWISSQINKSNTGYRPSPFNIKVL